MERKKRLIRLVLELFQEKGVNFSMDAVAAGMKMSKKTIYKEYGNKEDLIVLIVNALFEGIERHLTRIIQEDGLDTVEKLIRVSCAYPDTREVDYRMALSMKKDFPKAYDRFIHYIEEHWETKEALFLQGIREGSIKPVDFKIYKTILLGTIKQVLETDAEGQDEFLEQCVRQIMSGFLK